MLRPDEIPWVLGLLTSDTPRDRVYGLTAVAHRGTTDAAVLRCCEALLADHTITVLGIPYSFGEIRSCAAEAVVVLRRLRGESPPVTVIDLMKTQPAGASRGFARQAGIAPEHAADPITAEIATFTAVANHLPRYTLVRRPLARFDEVLALLDIIEWSQASEKAAIDARHLAIDYYHRLLPFWPAEREEIGPTDPVFEAAAFAERTTEQQRRIAAEARALIAKQDTTTQRLIPMVLAWAMARDSASLRPEDDPSVPLLDLWCLGVTLQQAKVGLELTYGDGFGTIRFPSRTQFL
jgi:hypothetical protein